MRYIKTFENYGYGLAAFSIPILNVTDDNRGDLKSPTIVSMSTGGLPVAIVVGKLMTKLYDKGVTKSKSASSLFKRVYHDGDKMWIQAKSSAIADKVKP